MNTLLHKSKDKISKEGARGNGDIRKEIHKKTKTKTKNQQTNKKKKKKERKGNERKGKERKERKKGHTM